MERRDFLKASLLTGVGLILPGKITASPIVLDLRRKSPSFSKQEVQLIYGYLMKANPFRRQQLLAIVARTPGTVAEPYHQLMKALGKYEDLYVAVLASNNYEEAVYEADRLYIPRPPSKYRLSEADLMKIRQVANTYPKDQPLLIKITQ